jgi:hypothetical protein
MIATVSASGTGTDAESAFNDAGLAADVLRFFSWVR